MDDTSPAGVVLAWQEALNREDHDAVLALSAPDVEIVGPRGSGRGLELLRGWLGHARVRLHPRRTFARGDAVVVEQHAEWRSPEGGDLAGEAEVASVFRVAGGRVSYYARFDRLADALALAGLSEADRA